MNKKPGTDNASSSDIRSTKSEIAVDITDVQSINFFEEIINSFPTIALILNKNRQVILANKYFIEMLGLHSPESIIGLRPGEIFNCVNVESSPQGCGTGPNCQYCGALQAVIESQRKKKKVTEESRIISYEKDHQKNWNLRVTSTPLIKDNKEYYIVFIEDISDQKRRLILERLFFHDIVNAAGGLNGYIEYLVDEDSPAITHGSLPILSTASTRILEDIQAQKVLLSAEKNELELDEKILSPEDILDSVVNILAFHPLAEGKEIKAEKPLDTICLKTDPGLLQRVLLNMLINAIEAYIPGEVIQIGAKKADDSSVIFFVNNRADLDIETQSQIFQRSFSTKSNNRGLGTYCMKLFGEKYLKGKVSFTSNAHSGTTFQIILPTVTD